MFLNKHLHPLQDECWDGWTPTDNFVPSPILKLHYRNLTTGEVELACQQPFKNLDELKAFYPLTVAQIMELSDGTTQVKNIELFIVKEFYK